MVRVGRLVRRFMGHVAFPFVTTIVLIQVYPWSISLILMKRVKRFSE